MRGLRDNAGPEVTVNNLERRITEMTERIAEAEALLRSLRGENAKLREAMAHADGTGAAGHASDPASRSLRVVALEAERDQVRARLKDLLEAL